MEEIRIAVAQVPSVKGDVDTNIEVHLYAIKKTSGLGVSFIMFPELSLTGYEPELAEELAFSDNDDRLAPLIKAGNNHGIYVAAGAPIKSESLPYIGAIIIYPDGSVSVYRKMNLHSGAESWIGSLVEI